jgi:hypothetical protein
VNLAVPAIKGLASSTNVRSRSATHTLRLPTLIAWLRENPENQF